MSRDRGLITREGSTLMRALSYVRGQHMSLTLTELVTLLSVAENEGVTIKGLSEICGYTMATASRTTRQLASPDHPGALAPYRGLLQLMRGPHENRHRHVFLTEAGLNLCRELDRIVTTHSGVDILESERGEYAMSA